jgi:hypothetical protein
MVELGSVTPGPETVFVGFCLEIVFWPNCPWLHRFLRSRSFGILDK